MKVLKFLYHWLAWKTWGNQDPDTHQCNFQHHDARDGWCVYFQPHPGFYCEKTRDHFGEHK